MAESARSANQLISADVIDFIEDLLLVPEGKDGGNPIKLRGWQRELLQSIYDRPTRRAIISFGRKNGKSALTAMLVLVHLVGPTARTNSQIYSAAQSRDQAAVVFGLAAKMIRQSPALNELITIRESRKELYCRLTGVTYRALSAEADKAYGLSPVLTIYDELGQVRGPRHELYDALETATGAQENPLSIIISTQAPSDSDLLSILIDDAREGHDPRTRLFLWTSDDQGDPFDIETIRKANPAFGDFQNAEEVLAMAADARRMPAREAQYRNLVLNQRVEAENPFITASVWMRNGETPDQWGVVFGGLDLSATNDLTALVLVSPVDGFLNVRPTFWLPEDGLAERSRQDRVPYDLWHKQGHLNVTPGRSVAYEYVAQRVAELFQQMNIRKIAFDRWNMRNLKPWLVKAGLSESFIDERFEDFGQGFQSMSPALRTLEELLLADKLRHGNHPVLKMCAANAVVKMDEAEGRKLDKKRSTGRIDGMVALAMASSMAAGAMHEKQVFPVPLDQIVEDLPVPPQRLSAEMPRPAH